MAATDRSAVHTSRPAGPGAGPGIARVRHLVLDRDGVLNQEDDRPVRDHAGWQWERGARSGLRLAAAHGLVVSVVTNQSAVGRGELDPDDLERLHAWLHREFLEMGLLVGGIYACPHLDEDRCECRKPAPGMVLEAVRSSGIAADRTLLVGDDLRDLAAAKAAGVAHVLVRTGKGRSVEAVVHRHAPVHDDLEAAVRAVVGSTLDVDRSGAADSSPMQDDLIGAAFEEHLEVLLAAREGILEDLSDAANLLADVLDAGSLVLVAGNGGSASDALHFVAELVGRFREERAAARAVALGVDAPTTTAIANDFGFEQVLARQVEALARPDDALVLLSTSATSPNVVAAAEQARRQGVRVVSFTGATGGDLVALSDVIVRVPSRSTARVQEIHGLCLHAVAETLEARLLGR